MVGLDYTVLQFDVSGADANHVYTAYGGPRVIYRHPDGNFESVGLSKHHSIYKEVFSQVQSFLTNELDLDLVFALHLTQEVWVG